MPTTAQEKSLCTERREDNFSGDDDEEERAFLTSLVAGKRGDASRGAGRVRLDTRTTLKRFTDLSVVSSQERWALE
jgi:hypothetical protein